MEKIIKFFPFMPEAKDTGKLVIAILIYFLGVPVVSSIVCAILGFTLILAPVGIILGLAFGVYSIAGLVFAIMSYAGYDFSGAKKAEEAVAEEAVAEEAPVEE